MRSWWVHRFIPENLMLTCQAWSRSHIGETVLAGKAYCLHMPSSRLLKHFMIDLCGWLILHLDFILWKRSDYRLFKICQDPSPSKPNEAQSIWIFCLFVLFFQNRVSLGSPGCIGTHSLGRPDGLELRDLPVSLQDAGTKGICYHWPLKIALETLYWKQI